MADKPDELLRTIEVTGQRYEIRRGADGIPYRVLLEVGQVVGGDIEWAPAFGLYAPGRPVGRETELRRHLAELRDADTARDIAAAQAKWERR